MKYTTSLKQVSAILFTLSLAACSNGGGSSSPQNNNTGGNSNNGGNTTSFPNRVTRVDYDYDNNGTTDATDTIAYDANGRVNLATYLYNDDGTADILNLRDTGTVQETNSFSYDSNGNLIIFIIDRLFQRIEVNVTYDNTGLLTRQDFQVLNSSGGQTTAISWNFAYSGQQLNEVDGFFNSNATPTSTQSFSYDSTGLPASSRFFAGSIATTTTFNWRSDGQLNNLDSQSDNGDSSSVVLTYDAQGLQQSQTWLNNGQGFNLSEITGKNYIRSIVYDVQNRPLVISYDQDSNGSVDATVTLTWESAVCIPATLWAPNAFPNFVRDTTRPFVPGSGFFTTQFCSA